MGKLGERDTKVLDTIIEQYINTGEPVGSRTVAKKSGLQLSSATIRNMMMDMEEQGLLFQPHTSAGRIPTSLGLRYYFDYILPKRGLRTTLKKKIKDGFDPPATELHDLCRQASRVLSTVSGHPAMVRTPRLTTARFKHIQFINLGGNHLLVVLVSHDGVVQNRFLEVERQFSQEQLDKFSRYLNDLLQNLSLEEARWRVLAQMEEERILFDKMTAQALTLSHQALQPEENSDLIIEGASQILDYPEFSEIDKLRGLFKTFEEKHQLIRLLDRSMEAQGVQIYISAAGEFPQIEVSLVASHFQQDLAPVGALGVIGPMRMDYARIVPLVEYTATVISNLLSQRR